VLYVYADFLHLSIYLSFHIDLAIHWVRKIKPKEQREEKRKLISLEEFAFKGIECGRVDINLKFNIVLS
jgi:hypothetical protein